MIAKAIAKYLRISPRKARLVTRPLKGMTVAEAYAFLQNVNKRAARLIHTALKSAFDNARKKDQNFKETDLYISRVTADSGPALRRFRAASMGRASVIKKRMSHLTIHLDAKSLPKPEKESGKSARRSIFKKAQGDKKKEKAASPVKSAKGADRVAKK
ncbi:MAG: 50S ribosomal protein L22 [Candidatus Omnitrophica bacterium]|nr:50S ribosomal protein L22 [Candidatus Omnitrophota bacterium]